MKTIGIKLADGSFYPVLNEGSPSERLLQLTTAHNNQTKVMVDLYRSELGSMEDAEYVDSLQIENLIEHPNGEPTLNFTVSIDENNRLSAKMVDNETGMQSNATITLVSRTLEERLLPDEYEIKDPTLDGVSLTETEENSLFGNDDTSETDDTENTEETEESAPSEESESEVLDSETSSSDADNLTDFELPVADFSSNVIDEFEAPVEETAVEHDYSSEELDDMREKLVAEPEAAETAEIPVENENADTVEIPEISDFNPLNEPILEDDALNIDEFSAEPENDTGDTNLTEENTQSTDLDLDLPDFDNLGNTTDTQDSPLDLNFDDNTSSSSSGSDDLNFDLDLPDFDTTASSESATSSDSLSDTSYLDDLDFDDLDDSTTQNKSQSTGKGLSFTGLYDKETEMGNSAASYDGDGGKNSRASVIICVLCAIICVLATLFVIMVIPQKFNVFGNKKGQETAKTEITELPDVKEAAQKNKAFAEEPAAEPIPAPAPLPPVPEAKEEEVVVIENAEDVVPLPPPVTPVKPKDITYKIKWGDTLWDISETYYKNPWRYKYIARYNGIKNPDYIVSGTFIQIPAE